MKRQIGILLALVLSVCLLSVIVSANASPSASWDGPEVIRAGNTITVTFSVNGKNISGMDGYLYYDKDLLTMVGEPEVKIGDPWVMEYYKDSDRVVIYDNSFETPINKEAVIFTLTFKVSSNADPEEELKVSCQDFKVSDGENEVSLGEVSFIKKIARPLSADSKLKSLTVTDVTLSPAFNADTTFYAAQVPYEVKKLEITAVANHSGAKVSITNPNLSPGATTNITVTVTAENGSTKTYTISVTRDRDPNYTEAGDNTLSNIQVEGFILSPGFTSDHTEYVVWAPYETDFVTVTGTANHSEASVWVQGGKNLIPGADNTVLITCTAEDGSKLVYTVVVKRAGPHVAEPDPTEPTEPDSTEPPTEPSTQPTEAPTEEPTQESTRAQTNSHDYSQQEKESDSGLGIGGLVILCVLILLVGIMIGILIGRVIGI